MQKLVKISKNQISSKGVQSLADRPNANAQYGVGGLSSPQLKLWFDKLASFLAEKINELQTTLASDTAADYIRIPLDAFGVGSLKDLVDSFSSGDFANKILRLNPSAASTTQTLQDVINDIAIRISENYDSIDEIAKKIIKELKVTVIDENIYLDLTFGDDELKRVALDIVRALKAPNIAYGTDETGCNIGVPIGYGSKSIPLYDENKRLKSGSPEADDDVVNKQYANNTFLKDLSRGINSHNVNAVYGLNVIGQNCLYKIDFGYSSYGDGGDRLGSVARRSQRDSFEIPEAVRDYEPVTFRQFKTGISDHERRLENLESVTLKYIEDSSVAYHTPVPDGVAKYALVEKIGGMTYNTGNLMPLMNAGTTSTNNGITRTWGEDGGITLKGTANKLCDIPLFYDNSAPKYLNGTYTVSLNKALPRGASLVLGNSSVDGHRVEILASGATSNTFEVASKNYEYFNMRVTEGTTFSGETYYPMLNEGATALPYSQYFEGLRDAKVKELVSTGANWWPHGDISVEKSGKYDLKLPAGKYTFSFDASCDDLDSNYSGIRLIRSNGPSTKLFTFERDKRVNITISCQDVKQIMFYASENAELSLADTLHISNMMINPGETALPYEPYRIVDTLSIPEKIQTSEGYGQGNPDNPNEYNYIDFEKKTFVALGHIVDGVWVAYEKTIETNISADLTDDSFIEVEAGGTIKVVNDNNDNRAVPTTICYVTKKGD